MNSMFSVGFDFGMMIYRVVAAEQLTMVVVELQWAMAAVELAYTLLAVVESKDQLNSMDYSLAVVANHMM